MLPEHIDAETADTICRIAFCVQKPLNYVFAWLMAKCEDNPNLTLAHLTASVKIYAASVGKMPESIEALQKWFIENKLSEL